MQDCDDDDIGVDSDASDNFDEELEDEQQRKSKQKLQTPLRHTVGV